MKLEISRLKCWYCYSLDAMVLLLGVMALTSKFYILPFAFAFGLGYVGVLYELIFQAEHYNFFSTKKTEEMHSLFWAGMFVVFIAFFFTGYVAPFLFLGAAMFMEVVNVVRYPKESPMIFDMVFMVPFILGIISIFYLQ